MKQLWIRGLSGLALAFTAHGAIATPVVITSTATSGPKILSTSQATIVPSSVTIGMINSLRVNSLPPTITADGGAIANIGYSTNPITKLTNIRTLSLTQPVTSLTFESADQQVTGNTLQGSFKVVVAANNSNVFSRGGEIAFKDVRIDTPTKTVYATVTGANGYGTRQNMPVWSYVEATGNLTFTGGNIATTLKVLRFTNDGINAWAQSLALNEPGFNSLRNANAGIDGFGNMTIAVNTTATPPEVPTCTAP